MTIDALLPSETMKTRDAAEAVYLLFQMFEPEPTAGALENWISELEGDWPDLAAMLFTVSRDE